jgi:hypothetical protein
VVGVGDLVHRIGEGRTGRVLGGRAIKRLGGAVCGLYRAHGDEKRGFLGSSSKPRSAVCQWFCLKTTAMVFSDLTSKPMAMVSPGLCLKTDSSVLVIWGLKSL